MVTVNWMGGMAFEATPESGSGFLMDAYPQSGGQGLGPTPTQAMLASVAACSAMDVLSILRKKKVNVTGYRVEVEGDRAAPEGQYPRPFSKLRVRHIVSGENVDPAAVERAVALSDEKYCSVIATMRAEVDVTSSYEIEEAAGA
jgi:putative redox protein